MSSLVGSLGSLRALNGLKSLKGEVGKVSHEYELLEYNDVDGNIKRIGDKIIEKIKKDYIDGNPNNTPEKIKAQIKKDLLVIYYENSGDRKVKSNIKDKVCQAWYGALRTRIEKILKDVVLLLNKEDISQKGGGFGLSGFAPKINPSGLFASAKKSLSNVSSNGLPETPEQVSDALPSVAEQPPQEEQPSPQEQAKQEEMKYPAYD